VRWFEVGCHHDPLTPLPRCLQVLVRWFEVGCHHDPLALLQRLDVHTYADEAEAGLRQLIAAGALAPLVACRQAVEAGSALGQRGAGRLVGAAEALLW